MYSFNFYNKKAEDIDGDYWKFLDMTAESILNNDIYLYKISDVIKQVTDESLKFKMKKKVFDLIVEKGIYFNGLERSLDIFSNEEAKWLLEREFNIKISKYASDEKNIQYLFSDIISFMGLLKNTNDSKWQYFMVTKIVDIIKNYSNKSSLVNVFEYNKDNLEVYSKLIGVYYEYLPITYKNYLIMQQDCNYIYNKSLQFMNDEIDIGIDSRISIGPEIEANIDYDIQMELNKQKGFEEYRVYRDATVPNGSEISPIRPFNNVKEDVAKFCGLCETMKDIGYYYSEVSQNASGQINLGLDYLDTKEAILNFYEIYGNCEELLYYISNEEGQLFRQDVYVNSRIKAISEIIGKRILDEELSRNDVIELFNSKIDAYNRWEDNTTIKGLQYKKNSVCLRGSDEESYRLEFRIPNGGCNYKTWIDNIRLYGKMMEVSKKLADSFKKDYLSSEEEQLLRLKIDLQDNSLPNEEKLPILMDLLFKDDAIKQIYYNRYTATIKKIKETNSNKYSKSFYTYQPGFDSIEFMDQYHSRLGPDYSGEGVVIEYDPKYGMVKPRRKK